MAVSGKHIGREIAEQLGLPSETTDILINIGLDEPISVTCRYYPNEESLRAVVGMLMQYRLEASTETPPQDLFTQDQRIRLFRQNLLHGDIGVETPYLKRYLAHKAELAEWKTLVNALIEVNKKGLFLGVHITPIYARIALLEDIIVRMEAGEAV